MTFNERISVLKRELSILEIYWHKNNPSLDDIERKLWDSQLAFKRIELQALEQINQERNGE